MAGHSDIAVAQIEACTGYLVFSGRSQNLNATFALNRWGPKVVKYWTGSITLKNQTGFGNFLETFVKIFKGFQKVHSCTLTFSRNP